MLAEDAGRRAAIGFSFRHSPTDGDPDMAFSRAFIILFCVATAVAILVRRFTVPDTHEEMSKEVATRLLRLDSSRLSPLADVSEFAPDHAPTTPRRAPKKAKRASSSTAAPRLTIREVTDPADRALKEADAILSQVFHRGERVALSDWKDSLQEKSLQVLTDVVWRLIVAESEGPVVGLASGDRKSVV